MVSLTSNLQPRTSETLLTRGQFGSIVVDGTMTSKIWVIGSSPECDIVIAKSNVSRKHCRLTLEDGRFLLQDLKSTNGTFVNGVQITGKVEVTRSDEITLGTSALFPWQDITRNAGPAGRSSQARQIHIGRDPDNDVVLDYEMISSRHALLTISGGQAILEDLGSTNGTAINSPENAIKRHRLDSGDMVFFGSLRVPAAKLLAADSKRKA